MQELVGGLFPTEGACRLRGEELYEDRGSVRNAGGADHTFMDLHTGAFLPLKTFLLLCPQLFGVGFEVSVPWLYEHIGKLLNSTFNL